MVTAASSPRSFNCGPRCVRRPLGPATTPASLRRRSAVAALASRRCTGCGRRCSKPAAPNCGWGTGPRPLVPRSQSSLPQDRTSSAVRCFPDLLNGTKTTCFAMSEPDAGSDIWRSRTSATRVDGGWLINRRQTVGDQRSVRRLDPGLRRRRCRCLCPPAGWDGRLRRPWRRHPGFRVDSVIALFGHSGGDEAILSFQDVFVPDANVIGVPGDGLRLALSGISMGRMYNSARAVGLADGPWPKRSPTPRTDRPSAHLSSPTRRSHSPRRSDRSDRVHAARLMGLDAACALDRGEDVRTRVSMCKAYSIEVSAKAIDHATPGARRMGFTNEVHLAEAWQQMVLDPSWAMGRLR